MNSMNSNHLQYEYDTQQLAFHNNLGMQLGTDLSTSHVENNFIGTGFAFIAEIELTPISAAIFNEYVIFTNVTSVKYNHS